MPLAEDNVKWILPDRPTRVHGDPSQKSSFPRQFRVPMFREAPQAARIPTISITRDYPVTAEGQLKTRIEAFVEMITG